MSSVAHLFRSMDMMIRHSRHLRHVQDGNNNNRNRRSSFNSNSNNNNKKRSKKQPKTNLYNTKKQQRSIPLYRHSHSTTEVESNRDRGGNGIPLVVTSSQHQQLGAEGSGDVGGRDETADATSTVTSTTANSAWTTTVAKEAMSPSTSSPWMWRVAASVVPPVPSHAPLERTSIPIRDVPLQDVTARISEFMKLNSVSCSYHHEQARVDCLTSYGLKFVVQLWRSQKTNKDSIVDDKDYLDDADNDPEDGLIVLEVQRRRGCSIRMRSVRKMLYKAVLRDSTAPPPAAAPATVSKFKSAVHVIRGDGSLVAAGTCKSYILPEGLRTSRHQQQGPLQEPQQEPSHQQDSTNTTTLFESFSSSPMSDPMSSSSTMTTRPLCWDLLCSNRKDENRLGMEMLLVLVTHDQVGRDKAEDMAYALAFGLGELGCNLRSVFLNIFKSSPKPSSWWNKSNCTTIDNVRTNVGVAGAVDCTDLDDVSSLEVFSERTQEREALQLLALQVVSTCLDIIMEKEQDYLCNEAIAMLDLSSNFWTQAMTTFLVNLEQCTIRPHEAALAAKCLWILESLQPDLLMPLTEATIVTRAIKAYNFGKQHHLLLEKESEKLLHCLNLLVDTKKV